MNIKRLVVLLFSIFSVLIIGNQVEANGSFLVEDNVTDLLESLDSCNKFEIIESNIIIINLKMLITNLKILKV